MAEALLRRHLGERGITARVHSAGTLPWRGSATPFAVAVMRERGLDLRHHRSRALTTDMVDAADLVLGMTRSHVWAVVARAPEAEPRAFLVGEAVRLGAKTGPRERHETTRRYVERLAAHRVPGHPVGRAQDEVADPAGEPIEVYRHCADVLDAGLGPLAALLADGAPRGA